MVTVKIPSRKSVERTPFLHITKAQLLALYDRLEVLEARLPEPSKVEAPRIKIRPLAPVEQKALEKTFAVVEKLCLLYRMRLDPTKPFPHHIKQASDELQIEFFEVESLLKQLPSLKTPSTPKEPPHKPLGDEYRMLFLGNGERSKAEAYDLEKLLRDSIEALGGLQQGCSKEDPGWGEVERNAATIYTALTGKTVGGR